MGMGLCPTRASRAWEPRYDSHNDYSDPNLYNLRSLGFRSAKSTSNSSDFAGRISRGKFTYYEEKVTTIQVSEIVNEELWV